ncbi:MAG: helix-turn-helix transcriptional regulator [Gemmatimonadetes bacterium]|nr:helix-turn-helix transcriptional regulator [Gemmatimonadota bacterium]
MPTELSPQSQLPLSVPVHQILLSMAETDRHGYAIIQDIRERTDGEVDLTASTLYGALSRMLNHGMIVEVAGAQPETGGAPRRTYRITQYGRSVARAEADRLARALDQARSRGLGPEAQATSREAGR